LLFGRLRQRMLLKSVPHVQHDYFSSFSQSDHCFLVLSLPLSLLKLPISTLHNRSNNRFIQFSECIPAFFIPNLFNIPRRQHSFSVVCFIGPEKPINTSLVTEGATDVRQVPLPLAPVRSGQLRVYKCVHT